MRRASVLTVVAVLAVGCGGDDDSAAPTTEPPATTEGAGLPSAEATLPAEGPSPELMVDVAWFDVDRASDVLRFLAYITNESDQPAAGVGVEWTAYDASDVIVGNFPSTMPTIPAGGSFPYVGGAGGINLTGTPARVDVAITDPGRLDDDAFDPFLVVEDERLEKQGRVSYHVRATASAPDREIDPSTVKHSMILFDESGDIILADFIGDVRGPATIPPGQRFGVEFYVSESPRVPARAEVTVWTD